MSLLGLLIVVALGGVIALASLKPNVFSVSRSAVIDAPAESVFARLVDFHAWKDWSPWARLDPNAKESFEGPESGVGSSMAWSGNRKVGAGKMTILECVRDELLRLKLDFERPLRGTRAASFELRPEGDATRLTWTMNGRNDFQAKLFSLFVDLDKLIGGDFEQGLANLKALVEEKPAA
ncbi:MAG TPA: SRPBCC family protein [Methylocystis sp.]|nr:SRPBCC family protein [Methylocystis sp.]